VPPVHDGCVETWIYNTRSVTRSVALGVSSETTTNGEMRRSNDKI
jgi:hypothetical protein